MSNQQLSTVQAAQYAVNAGFTGSALITMISVATAESSLQTQPEDYINSDGSRDRGWLQINNKAHPDVSDACAYDPQCAASAAWKISQQGQNFGAWADFTNGKYLQHVQTTIKELRGVTFKNQNPNDLSGTIGQNSPAPGSFGQDLVNGAIAGAIQGIFQPIIDNLHVWGVKIGLFMGALMLVIIGFWVLGSGPAGENGTISPALNNAAKVQR